MTDLLPRNATTQERAMANTVARISSVQTPIRSLWSPQDCPADFLPWLAWGLSLDTWDSAWTETQKRAAIAASVEVHRRKGTIGALKRALEAIGYEVNVNEATGQAYVFRLEVDVTEYGGITPDLNAKLAEAEQIALAAKNTRSYLAGVDAVIRPGVQILILAATIDGVETEVLPA